MSMTSPSSMTARVPLVDLSGAFEPGTQRDEAVDAIRQACEDVGFLLITGHGISAELLQRVDFVSRQLFALPLQVKMSWVRHDQNRLGYVPLRSSALALAHDEMTPPDLAEAFSVSRFDDPADAVRAGSHAGAGDGRADFFAPNVWPDPKQAPGFREALNDCYAVLEALAADLMRLMALALNLDEHWFDDKIAEHITGLTVLHYPELQAPPLPGQYRRGPHTDWGSLTILHHDSQPGLQVLSPEGTWTDIPSVADSLVVNLGDLMAAWTNDRWVSTQHRVVVHEQAVGSRISVAFFHQPAYDAVIECIPTCASSDDLPHHEPVTSGEWIRRMIKKTHYH